MHRSQMTSSERERARADRRANTPKPNKDGSVSYFHQARADDCPSADEVAASVQWSRGVESNTGTVHRWGATLDAALK